MILLDKSYIKKGICEGSKRMKKRMEKIKNEALRKKTDQQTTQVTNIKKQAG